MTINIPDTVFNGLVKWMVRGPWPEYFQEAIDDHLHAYCDEHDLDTFDELAEKIGRHWVTTLNDIAMNDFLSRETEDGNVVDLYLKRRGWNEKSISKAYLRGIRNSVMSLYEISDIRPGESFLARDLILGGDPIRVEERSGTQSMVQWEHLAMRVVDVRGHWILAGGVLPFEPELSEQVVQEIYLRADEAGAGLEEMLNTQNEYLEPEVIENLSLAMVLKMSASLFSEAWLAETVLDPADLERQTLVNAEGDEIEFIQLHCKLANGATQKQLRELLDAAPDLSPTTANIWNWVALDSDRPQRRNATAGNITYNAQLEDGAIVRGMVELKGKKLVADTNSAGRAEQLTARLQDLLGDLISTPVMVRQTLDQAMAEYSNKPVLREQPEPLLEVEGQLMKEFYDRHYRETLDLPVPMLGNKTPRRLAKTPKGKQQVASWLKYLEKTEVKNQKSQNTIHYDFLWMWEELGITELRK